MKKILCFLFISLCIPRAGNASSFGFQKVSPSIFAPNEDSLTEKFLIIENRGAVVKNCKQCNEISSCLITLTYTIDFRYSQEMSQIVFSCRSKSTSYLAEDDIKILKGLFLMKVLAKSNRVKAIKNLNRENMPTNEQFRISSLLPTQTERVLIHLTKVRVERNFFPVDVNDYEGFGIRLRI